jgi:hypothetical protein
VAPTHGFGLVKPRTARAAAMARDMAADVMPNAKGGVRSEKG